MKIMTLDQPKKKKNPLHAQSACDVTSKIIL